MASADSSTVADAHLPEGFKRRLLGHLLPELGPLLLFFLTFMWKGIIWATAAYAGATVVALGVTWTKHRQLPTLPLILAGLVLVFCGLTLALDDAVFIKIKPTVINGFFGLVLGIGWIFGYRLVERVLEPECHLDEKGLRALTLRVSAYMLTLAVINEVVWRTMTTEQWVIFKVFVVIAFNLVFAWSQLPLVRRHLKASEA